MINAMKRIFTLLTTVLFAGITFAQTSINLQEIETKLKVKSSTSTNLQVENKIKELEFSSRNTEAGTFSELQPEGYHKNLSGTPGEPSLPVHTRLIEVPHDAELVVTVTDYDETIYDLNTYGLDKIAPLQPSYSKSTDPENVEFHYNETLYNADAWIDPEIATASINGVMRGVNIGQITINPFQYNPGTNELVVLNNIKIDISFEGGDQVKTQNLKEKYYSPQFGGAYSMLLNYQPPASKDTFTEYPIKYVIVADRQFETTLQPFIEWKTKSGYNVVEGYTDVIGSTTGAIQTYLQDLYDNGTAGDPAPTYVLIIGDHDGNYNVPAFGGETGEHVTDLYYGCYDGTSDNIPDLYLGRMSANSTTELQNIMDKIIPYEKYTIPDGSYLNKCMLIAGVDGDFAPTHGDGTISYGIREYFNTTHDFTDIFAYYYSYTQGDYHVMSSNDGAASGDIISKISDGVGFANYTAHCNWNGWGDPSVTNSDISSFNNQDEYAFMIGNCCLSYKFNESDAFGEEVLQTANKGAINYIGTSNNSYWDEDVYWGIGLTSLAINETNVPNHDYSNTGQGGYDGMWHEHGESFDEWFFTGGQMVYCANMQVEASSSGRKQYYWEIYHNSGDPSLMPYMTEPESLTINYTDPAIGATSLTVNTEAYTYVAISQNGVLLDAQWSGSGTSVTLNFSSLTSDPASIVATKQDKVPHINDFTPISPNPPVADFSGTPTTLLEGESVTFTDLSDYPAEWDWDFGDGGTSTEQNPVHTYTSAGTYTVSLTVTNTEGTDTETKTDYITVNVNTNPPAADFEADQTNITVGGTVNFTDLSANNPDSWSWTFEGGDPATSTAQNPSVTYNTVGTYDVELTASNGYGNDTETKTGYITVSLPEYCDAGADAFDQLYMTNFELNTISNATAGASYSDFTNLSTDVLLSDTYSFTVEANTGFDYNQCLIWVDWNTDGDFEDTGEEVFASPIENAATYTGNITIPATANIGETTMRIRIAYNRDGYNPNDTPCGNSGHGEVEDYTLNITSPEQPPTAAFSASPTSTCDGIVQFTDESTLADSWEWDFGDGNTSTEQNPEHTYTSDGNYTVSLTATNSHGSDTHTETDYIAVDMPEAPTVTDAENCGPGEMTLTASGSGTLNWYDAETGGNLVNTGTSLTDNFDVTTSYYVESEVPGPTHSVGKVDNSGTGDYFGNVDYVHGLIFDAYTNFTINSVKVYADGGKDRVINLKDESGTIIETRTVSVPDGESRIDLNIDVPAGNNYTIECDGDADLYRNSDGTNYPYEISGIISIHYNTADDTNYYYYFYDWEIQEGTCTSPRAEVIATVHDLPTVDIGADQTICETDDASFDAGAGFATYNWSNSSTSQSITVNTADTYSVTVTDNNGCTAEDAATLSVDAMPDATIDPVADLCEDEGPVTLTAATGGGTWDGLGITGDSFDPGTAGPGDHTVTYEVTNGECTASDNISIHVDAIPDITIDPVDALCVDDSPVTLSATPTGGTWNGTGVSGDQFDPSVAGIGTHTITYEVSDGACTSSDNIDITVSDYYDATIDAIADLCESDAAITLTAADAGGTWSGNGITDANAGTFDPAVAGPGDHTITYEISGSCGDSDTETIHVDDMPDATIDDPGDFCEGDAAVTLTAAETGGSWSGTGVSGDQFDPSVAGIGDHVIEYEIVNGACTASDQVTVSVTEYADATIDAVADLCETDAAITLTAADAGGTWSGDGITDANAGTFDPAVAGPGDHTITYQISGTCGDSDTETIHVDDMPDATIDDPGDFCEGDAAVTLTAAETGGSWSGPGVTANQFDPSVAGIGDHVIEYEIVNGACTASDQITVSVTEYADATINAVADLCETDAAITLTAEDAGGTWSGAGVTGDEFDPATTGPGDHTISYEISGQCGDYDETTIHVDAMPDASITYPGAFCLVDPATDITAATPGGTWSGTGITDTVNGTFDPGTAGTGNFVITYEITDGACHASDQITLYVSDGYDATIDPVSDLCENDDYTTLTAEDAGGTWSGDGITDANTGTFDPAVAGPGDHTITYEISGSCGDSDTETIHVDDMPDATINDPGDFCAGDDPDTLTAADAGGTWNGPGVSGNEFDPASAGIGTHTISYIITNGACVAEDNITIEVADYYDATITPVDDLCESDPVVTLDAVDAGGTWSGDGVSGNEFDPAAAGPGDHIITYSFTGACGNSDQITIHVDEMPDASITDPGSLCVNDDPVTLTAVSTGGTWNGNAVTGDQFDPGTAGVGTHVVTYEILNGACNDFDSFVISVGAGPVINITVTNATTPTSTDGSATASASGGLSPYSYYWSNGDADATMENVPSGNYSVMVTDAAGCVSTAPVFIDFLNNIAGNTTSIKIYPNPAENKVFVKMTNMNAGSIELVNMLGQKVINKNVQSNIETLNVQDLKPGVYFVRIITSDENHVKKLMVE